MEVSTVPAVEASSGWASLNRIFAHSEATGTDLVVLLVLARHEFNADSEIRPTRAYIAKLAHVSVKRVGEALHRLSVLKQLRRTIRKGKPTIYEILVECPPDCPEVGKTGFSGHGIKSAPQGSRQSAPQGSHERSKKDSSSARKRKNGAGVASQLHQPKPAADLADVEARIGRAIDAESQRSGDPDSEKWIARLVRTTGDVRRDFLAEWEATRATLPSAQPIAAEPEDAQPRDPMDLF